MFDKTSFSLIDRDALKNPLQGDGKIITMDEEGASEEDHNQTSNYYVLSALVIGSGRRAWALMGFCKKPAQ
jgi:hypothetical protein